MARELTSGARHDAPVCDAVLDQCPAMPPLASVVMDTGDDREHMRQPLQDRELTPVIPPTRHRQAPIIYDAEPYQVREQVERFFNQLTQFRRMATRDETRRQTCLAFIDMVALWVMIK